METWVGHEWDEKKVKSKQKKKNLNPFNHFCRLPERLQCCQKDYELSVKYKNMLNMTHAINTLHKQEFQTINI